MAYGWRWGAAALCAVMCLAGAARGWRDVVEVVRGQGEDATGRSVALSADGSVLAVGLAKGQLWSSDRPAGAARVFRLSEHGGAFAQLGGELSSGEARDSFGQSVALDASGTVLAVGAASVHGLSAGVTRAFRLVDGRRWEQLGQTLRGELLGVNAVALSPSGRLLAVGSPLANNGSGAVRLYRLVGAVWEQEGADFALSERELEANFGAALALTDGMLVVGAPHAAEHQGRVLAWKLQASGTWGRRGADIVGAAGEHLGASLALSPDGSTLAAGGGAAESPVRIFDWSAAAGWGKGQRLAAANDASGTRVALSAGPGASTLLAVSGSETSALLQRARPGQPWKLAAEVLPGATSLALAAGGRLALGRSARDVPGTVQVQDAGYLAGGDESSGSGIGSGVGSAANSGSSSGSGSGSGTPVAQPVVQVMPATRGEPLFALLVIAGALCVGLFVGVACYTCRQSSAQLDPAASESRFNPLEIKGVADEQRPQTFRRASSITEPPRGGLVLV
jgi:hypothetical protein